MMSKVPNSLNNRCHGTIWGFAQADRRLAEKGTRHGAKRVGRFLRLHSIPWAIVSAMRDNYVAARWLRVCAIIVHQFAVGDTL